jgi:hypothetical protein
MAFLKTEEIAFRKEERDRGWLVLPVFKDGISSDRGILTHAVNDGITFNQHFRWMLDNISIVMEKQPEYFI